MIEINKIMYVLESENLKLFDSAGGATIFRPRSQGRHFNFFLGGQFFFSIFQCHRTIEKLEKNSTLYVVMWRYL